MKIFHLPDLGEGLPDAEIHEWHVNVGDTVKLDQPLVSMETAKAIVEVPAPQAGKITNLHGKPGDIIKTGAPLVEFESDMQKQTKDTGTVVGNIESTDEILEESFTIGAQKKRPNEVQPNSGIKALPAARALAKRLNIELQAVTGTGPHGLITAQDVEQFMQTQAGDSDLDRLRGTRRTMASTMAKSQAEIVPVTLFDEVDIDNWLKGTDITVRLLQALIVAAQKEPALNAWYDANAIGRRLHSNVNIGLAVDTGDDLFVPVIKDAQSKSSTELRAEINRLKTSVKNRDISPSDLQGATITLSNFGNFAGRFASPIVVPPMVAILGVGKLYDAVLAVEGKPAVRRILPLSLTFDHRGVTGGEATRFLGCVMADLEAAQSTAV